MSDIVQVVIDNQTIYFESDDTSTQGETSKMGGPDQLGDRASETFQAALKTVQAVVSSTVKHVRQFDQEIAPDEFQLQFGVKLSGEYGAIVTKVGAEAQLVVTVTYKHPKPLSE